MLFITENVKENTMYFLVVQIIDKSKEFTACIYRKATLSRAYTILGAFYNLLIILERSEHFLMDACGYAQDGLNYTLNYFF